MDLFCCCLLSAVSVELKAQKYCYCSLNVCDDNLLVLFARVHYSLFNKLV